MKLINIFLVISIVLIAVGARATAADEADKVVLVGDIDNLGFGWPSGFDVFSGQSTPAHGYPYYPDPTDPPGTDRIMVGTGHTSCADGYCGTTTSPDNRPQAITMQYDLGSFQVQSAILQMFVDDFQAPRWGSKFQATLNGQRAPFLEDILNSLDQTGPVGKLITVQIPQEFLPLVRSGHLEIYIDDPTTGIGDGYAIDFVRLLVNPHYTKVGTVSGKVTDAKTGQPLAGATVSASGIISGVTGSDGTYLLRGIPAGLVVVTASRSGYTPKTSSVDLVADASAVMDLSLNPAVSLPEPAVSPPVSPESPPNPPVVEPQVSQVPVQPVQGACPAQPGSNAWDTAVGQNCFEQWISEVTSRLNAYDGDKNFNANKPWSINKYGITENKYSQSAYAPDDFPQYNNNKYWYMWAHADTKLPDQNYIGAGVPLLRDYVCRCIARAGVTSTGPVTSPNPPATASTPGQGCREGVTSLYTDYRAMNPGQEVVIPIMMCNARDVANMDLTVTYDNSVLRFKSAVKGSLNADMMFDSNNVGNTVKIAFAGKMGFSGTGSIAILTFTVIGQNGSSSPITIHVNEANTRDGEPVVVSIQDGQVNVGNTNPNNPGGNPTGKPTSLDALKALQMSVGKLAVDMNYDLTKDGKVTSGDAREILKLVVQ